jgi:hypothetical protein
MDFSAYELLKNETVARNYLIKKYPADEAKSLAYRNVHSFTSYIKQGLALFQTADNSDFWSKPLLLYYGMMSLLKAFALSKDAHYPKNTLILQHGLTSPKRKKEPYRFYRDEVRVQKDGFFPYLCRLLNHPVPTGERFKMEQLCSFLPDLDPLFYQLEQISSFWNVTHQHGKITLEESILDELCISANSFVAYLNQVYPSIQLTLYQQIDKHIILIYKKDILQHPWFVRNKQGDILLWKWNQTSQDLLPEVLTYYALLFSLSMLCRYDPPVWRELCNDIVKEQLIIEESISLVVDNFPSLILSLLFENTTQ